MNTIDTAPQPEPATRETEAPGDQRADLISSVASQDKRHGRGETVKDGPQFGNRTDSMKEAPSASAEPDHAVRPVEAPAQGYPAGGFAPEEKSGPALAKSVGAAAMTIDAEFVAVLDSRMAKADLKELGWRDRQDLDDIMSDLERLSAVSWKQAASLWDKYRPDDPDKPIFIDGDDKDPLPQPAPGSPVGGRNAPRTQRPEAHGSRSPSKGDDLEANVAIPPSLAKRYLIAENKFYFRDDPNLLAFEDKGKRLATEHNDPMVARSMVELAHAKNWGSIKVKGTDEFKREVWLSASFRGIEVEGYQPREIDIARLAELRGELRPKQQNSIERGQNREKPDPRLPRSTSPAPESYAIPSANAEDRDDTFRNLSKQQRVAVDTLRAILTQRGDSATAIEMAANLASERFQQQRVYVGRLLAHGRAPYENTPDEKMNYFVTLKTINGERTIWGVDLERGVNAGGIQTGDDIALIYRGKKRVKVLANERDDAGKSTGKQISAEVNRNTWEVGKLDKMRDEARTRAETAAQHSDRNQPIVPVYDVPATRRNKAVEPRHTRDPDQSLLR